MVQANFAPQTVQDLLQYNLKSQDLQPQTWVELLELPNPYSHDEALLLCQTSSSEWVVWIPEHGEVILHRSQFR